MPTVKQGKYVLICTLICIILLQGCGFDNKEVSDNKEAEITEVPEEGGEKETEQEKPLKKQENSIQDSIQNEKKDFLIAIDPGHQAPEIDMSALEANAPDSTVLKMKATGGTRGSYSGIPEYQLNLEIALMLKEKLEAQGYGVLMTRENNETAISNAERAILANNEGADISVRIHANGSEDISANGALVLIGSGENPYVGHLYEESYRLGECVLNHYCAATDMQNLGIQANDTMTGINWSSIPVIILEMGFMTNEQDDLNMADLSFRERMTDGIVQGIHEYYEGFKKTLNTEDQILDQELQTYLQTHSIGEDRFSAYIKNLSENSVVSINESQMQSASLIKLFVAGTVYENMEILSSQESHDGETEELIHNMLSQSDNDATNLLISRLGNGDASEGMRIVNQFCEMHYYKNTHMGRLMLDFAALDDNYTSTGDCGLFLEDIYQNKIPGSSQISAYLKNQVRREKIPSGIPEGTEVGNKTGELDTVENDAAIVYTEAGDYIICVMFDQLQDTALARTQIREISSIVYQYIQRK